MQRKGLSQCPAVTGTMPTRAQAGVQAGQANVLDPELRDCPACRHPAGRSHQRCAHHGRAVWQVGASQHAGRAALAPCCARRRRCWQHGGRTGALSAAWPMCSGPCRGSRLQRHIPCYRVAELSRACSADSIWQVLMQSRRRHAGRDRTGGARIGGPARARLHGL